MSKPFNVLRNKMSPAARKRASTKVTKMLKEMVLQELRQARDVTQEQLAKLLDTKQANVSRLERRTDICISSLRDYIQAMGGELDIVARFPDHEIHIKFSDLSENKKTKRASSR